MKINYICNFCNKSLPSACFYHKHLMLKHNIILSKEDFYDLYVRKSPNEGKCLTCGKQTNFYKISGKTYTYKLYCDDSCIRKNKNIIKKTKNTKKERYGNENFNNSNKAKETCIKKYGKTSFTKTKELLKEKTKCLKDNNVKIIIDCNEYIEYVISKYGLDFISSCKCEK